MTEVVRRGRLAAASAAMIRALELLEEAGRSEATVLIRGETGTGKEGAAELIHASSRRARGPFIVVDCASVAPTVIESELFGHVRGAFTDSAGDRPGAFEAAQGGTVFIDEIGELPLEIQPRLLRVLERGQIKRVGQDQFRTVDVRVVAATHRDLDREVEQGHFRRDLLYRLKVLEVRLPPLRDRPEDVAMLAEHFLAELGRGELRLSEEIKDKLRAHRWPGNVRELRNVIERGVALSTSAFMLPAGFDRPPPPPPPVEPPAAVAPAAPRSYTEPLWRGRSYKDARLAVMEDFERAYLESLLDEHQGNVSQAARAAGLHRNLLHRMMSRYGLDRRKG